MKFSHLHCHTQYSLLDGAANISALFKKAEADNMPAIAITDHGNMFGVFNFVAEAAKHKGVKPIVGCEFYLVEDRFQKTFTKEKKDKRYHQLFLAKDELGYQNLTKLCSLGFIDGLYSKYPRIDKELVLKYHEGLIATTCCLGASIPQAILMKGEDAARKEFEWWLDIFGEDYYVELQRHYLKDQITVNEVLLRFAKEYNVKTIASNDSHYVDKDDSNAHDILLCINTGEKQSTPKWDDFTDEDSFKKNSRFAFPNNEFYFKKTSEMTELFHDLPEAIDNTNEIVDKIKPLQLKKDILLPHFQVPIEFGNDQDEYLRHLTYIGAKERYKDITPEIEERLNFELYTVKTMGFAGYFLIVSDFIKAGRELGVFIGPGRGSAAGSAVAYCIGITNIDPIKYNLLFERFLNPDRKSMPDIDTDFDDEGRQKVIDYVVQKYGKNQVAHIVTYGTMASKMSIKDVARVLDLPLDRSNSLAKLVPDKPGITLNRIMNAPLKGAGSLEEKEALNGEDIENCKKLRSILEDESLEESNVLKEALVLEGSVRGTGIHAAGIIIAPKDLSEIIPVFTAKDVDLLVTQYEGSIIEDAGVIKMDFLGLKNLTIIRDALRLIKQNHQIEIDIDNIPLDDELTFQIFQKGETNGIFQFESDGMKKHLKDLRPDRLDDLIAMNALYRPGPLQYIPNFINRKLGKEKIVYDLPEMEEHLKETYGITVYQEQVMLLSQKLAGFSKGDADVLRKAMGKKQKNVLDKMKGQFVEGAVAKGHPANVLEKIWADWEAFASYAFNKSHSTCYSFVAYQTAYLKANYPAEYMAAVLSNNQSNIDKITFFMEECKRMGIKVKGPDINESDVRFTVNNHGEIRFALSAIKGVGEAAVESIIFERKNNGQFVNYLEFIRRLNLRTVNKKVLESLCNAGAFDCFNEYHRKQYFTPVEKFDSFIELSLKYGNNYQSQKQSTAISLFGDFEDSISIPEPIATTTEPWSLIELLTREKEVVGIFISGHPLDDFRNEINNFVSCSLKNIDRFKNQRVKLAAFVSSVDHRISKKGTGWGKFIFQDFEGELELSLFGEDYMKFKHLMEPGMSLYLMGNYQQNKWKETKEFELQLTEVKQLASVMEAMTDSISIQVALNNINEAFVNQLEKLVKSNKGKHTLKLNVVSPELQNSVLFVSKNYKVKVSNELMDELKAIGVECKLN
ncbi:MAG: DNA polymerase III subunit alpha [Saprospiraceae bacterium]|nr:DNA polymerase III subunit alpha [Saprospiraceae bacterium]